MRHGFHFGQGMRAIVMFWLIILSCSTPMVAVFTVPVLFFVVRKFLRIRKLQKVAMSRLQDRVVMAQYAAKMKAWGS